MDLEGLQAQRTQLVYEFGEIEYERSLHVQRLKVLDKEYESKISELQEIESQIHKISQSIEKFGKSELYIEKNDKNSLQSE